MNKCFWKKMNNQIGKYYTMYHMIWSRCTLYMYVLITIKSLVPGKSAVSLQLLQLTQCEYKLIA